MFPLEIIYKLCDYLSIKEINKLSLSNYTNECCLVYIKKNIVIQVKEKEKATSLCGGYKIRLTLYDCDNVRDVSALGNVYMLTINFCENVRNVSATPTATNRRL